MHICQRNCYHGIIHTRGIYIFTMSQFQIFLSSPYLEPVKRQYISYWKQKKRAQRQQKTKEEKYVSN